MCDHPWMEEKAETQKTGLGPSHQGSLCLMQNRNTRLSHSSKIYGRGFPGNAVHITNPSLYHAISAVYPELYTSPMFYKSKTRLKLQRPTDPNCPSCIGAMWSLLEPQGSENVTFPLRHKQCQLVPPESVLKPWGLCIWVCLHAHLCSPCCLVPEKVPDP